MRKIWMLSLAIALLVIFTMPALADSQVRDTEKWLSVNNTVNHATVVIPNSALGDRAYIQPGKHRIVSLTVIGYPAIATGANGIPVGATSTEAVAAIYDATTAAGAGNKQLEGEVESEDSDQEPLVYDRSLAVKNGIVLVQGAWTVAIIEYERMIP